MTGPRAASRFCSRRNGRFRSGCSGIVRPLLLSRGVVKLDMTRDAAPSVEDHRPCRLGDLASAKAGLDRQQDHDAIALGISVVSGAPQGSRKLLFCKRFGVL